MKRFLVFFKFKINDLRRSLLLHNPQNTLLSVKVPTNFFVHVFPSKCTNLHKESSSFLKEGLSYIK